MSQKHNLLGQFNSLEHLAVDGEDRLDQSTYNGLTFHMRRLRAAIAEALWRQEIFVSVTIIDECVFHEVHWAENNVKPTGDEHLKDFHKRHLCLKDEIYKCLQVAKST